MKYESIVSPIVYKTIYLNTSDAVASTDRKIFSFNDMPLIQVRGSKSILKINSITLSGSGISSASNKLWTIKLKNVNYNHNCYFNSDKLTNPTIAHLNFDNNNSIQSNNFSLELTTQDINQPVLEIFNDHGEGATHIDFHISLSLCEYE